MATTTKTITLTEFFPSTTPAEIYDAVLNGAKHSRMTGAKATGSARVGSKFSAWDGYISGINLELDPGKRILQEWQSTEWPEGAPPSHLEWIFTAKKDGTEVELIHSRIPADQAESYRQGWIDYYWIPMKEYFAK
jgi:activator of HSP90 ATPase